MPKPIFNLILGVCGSVAAIKLPNLIESLRAKKEVKMNIKIVLTRNSRHFLNINDLKRQYSNLSDNSVEFLTDEDEWKEWKSRGDPVLHIELRKWADVILISPIDANTLAKVATGLADNLLTSVLRCIQFLKNDYSPSSDLVQSRYRTRPEVVICPAMNTQMWNHPITFEQIQKLQKEWGFKVINPISKNLMCGDVGIGAMEEVEVICSQLINLLLKQ